MQADNSAQNAHLLITHQKVALERFLPLSLPVSITLCDTLPGGVLGGYAWQRGVHCIYLILGENLTQRFAHEWRHAWQKEQGKRMSERDAEQWAQWYVVSL